VKIKYDQTDRVMRKLKVLFVGPLPPPVHGVAVLQEILVTSDLKNRFNLAVLDIADRGRNAQKTIGKLTFGNVATALWSCWRLLWKLVIFRPDVVFLFISQNQWGFFRDAVMIRLAHTLGARIVANLNGAGFRDFYESCPLVRQRRMRRTLGKISVVQVLGCNLRPIFDGLIPEDRIEVTPNGISSSQYFEVAEARAKRQPGQTLLYLSALAVSKGLVDLIDAFELCAEEFPESRLLVAGSWFRKEDKEQVLERVEKAGLGERIEFLGVVTGREKLDTFERSDIFLLPTWYSAEGQPVSILEAMASGLPVISCDRGAITEMVVDGKGGFIVMPRQPEEIAQRLRKLFSSPELVAAQGMFNVERVKRRFTLESFIDKVESDILCVAKGC